MEVDMYSYDRTKIAAKTLKEWYVALHGQVDMPLLDVATYLEDFIPAARSALSPKALKQVQDLLKAAKKLGIESTKLLQQLHKDSGE
jgi:hypothetical protein